MSQKGRKLWGLQSCGAYPPRGCQLFPLADAPANSCVNHVCCEQKGTSGFIMPAIWKCKDTEILTKPQRHLLVPEFYLFVWHHECLMTGWVLLQCIATDTSVSGIPPFPSALWISLWPRATWILFWTAERCRMLLDQGRFVSSLMNFALLRDALCLTQRPQSPLPRLQHTQELIQSLPHHLKPIPTHYPSAASISMTIKITGREFIE